MDDNNAQYDEGFVDVGDGHQIYYGQHGNPYGVPIVYVHGGPGARTYPSNAALVDLTKYRFIRFDQRGTGLSQYTEQLKGQTIANQVQDMEALRNHLNVDKWVLFGGSYGTTLSSHYRIAYPENVSAHVMRAMFFGDEEGARHISDGGGYGAAYAVHSDTLNEATLVDPWLAYTNSPQTIDPALKYVDFITAYNQLMNCGDPNVETQAGLIFDRMDTAIATAVPNSALINALDETPEESLNLTRLFFHYAQNEFTPHCKRNILAGLNATSHIPTTLIHGKRDFICPVRNAEAVKAACPDVKVVLVDNAGHSLADKPLHDTVIKLFKGRTIG
ncbi:MAG: hypothetical protein CL561_11380 [Alphaproteobacteria bacterium]|nr:hypothetical protein [Alphaproteobacteria bacterium]